MTGWRKRQIGEYMTKDEALRIMLEAITTYLSESPDASEEAVEGLCDAASIARRVLAQPAPVNLRRGNILRCIETDELCTVWATSTMGKTLVKWSGNDFTDYTAEQIGELFWLEPESSDIEIAAEQSENYAAFHAGVRFARAHTTATQPTPVQERNFCLRCGKRTRDLTHIHTCTPPEKTHDD